MLISPDDLIKLLAALLIGSIIGFEREIHAKAAGLRTMMLICVGATLFTLVSIHFTGSDPGRVAANIVSGVGFLGAGAILLIQGRVKGLTTASSIWVAAGLGMAIGIGQFGLAIVATILVMIVLWLLMRLDRVIDMLGRETRTYAISYIPTPDKYHQIEQKLTEHGLNIIHKKRLKIAENLMQGEWETQGPINRHNKFVDDMLDEQDVIEVNY